jgi:hypothetical protein
MHRMVRHAMCALMPPVDDLPGLVDVGADAFVARFLGERFSLLQLGVVAGSALFVITPLVTIGVPLPSFWLSAERLDRHADKAATSRFYVLRNLVFLVKMMAATGWGADPAVRARLGCVPYPPDPGTWRTT